VQGKKRFKLQGSRLKERKAIGEGLKTKGERQKVRANDGRLKAESVGKEGYGWFS
jgi:hypothetical protein